MSFDNDKCIYYHNCGVNLFNSTRPPRPNPPYYEYWAVLWFELAASLVTSISLDLELVLAFLRIWRVKVLVPWQRARGSERIPDTRELDPIYECRGHHCDRRHHQLSDCDVPRGPDCQGLLQGLGPGILRSICWWKDEEKERLWRVCVCLKK